MTSLTFVLPHAARVIFVVKQVSPVCRTAGRFRVKGHAGPNRIRFSDRTGKLQLDPGTYRITARTRTGRVVKRVTILVVDSGVPTAGQIAAARASDLCGAASRLAVARGSTGASNTSNVSSPTQDQSSSSSSSPPVPSASGPTEGRNGHSGAVLGTAVEKAARAAQPLFIALLAVAIVLLGLASLPRVAFAESRANEVLARHRTEIAALGAAAFVAVVIAFVLG